MPSPSAPPADPFAVRPRSSWEMAARVAVYFRPYARLIAANVLLMLLALGASLLYPRITQYIIDSLIARGDVDLLLPAVVALLAAFLLRDVFSYLRIKTNSSLKINVLRDIRCDLYEKLQRLPIRYFDQHASGDLMTRLIDDANVLESVLVDGAEQSLSAGLTIAAVGALLFIKDPYLALLALLPVPFLTIGIVCYAGAAIRRHRLLRQAFSALNAPLSDSIQGMRLIKAFNAEPFELERFKAGANRLGGRALDIFRAWAAYSSAMAFGGSLAVVLTLWGGGKLVAAGAMSVGELVAFIFYLNLFYQPFATLHTLNQNLQAVRSAAERVFDIMDAEPERRKQRGAARFRSWVLGDVEFENVSFAYEPGRDAIENVSLHARAGQTIALVGETGSGKSTLVNLLMRFYEPDSGRIIIDGVAIADAPLDDLRAQIALVTQENFLFNTTVRENLLCGKRSASEQELLAASRAANCHEFIERLPLGYDTLVGERGVKLSVGEKQRISIARALLKDAPILILDEATASVDTVTERLIQEALQRLMTTRTCFVIAHRLATIRDASEILVFANGAVVERGAHSQLVARDGVYAALLRPKTADADAVTDAGASPARPACELGLSLFVPRRGRRTGTLPSTGSRRFPGDRAPTPRLEPALGPAAAHVVNAPRRRSAMRPVSGFGGSMRSASGQATFGSQIRHPQSVETSPATARQDDGPRNSRHWPHLRSSRPTVRKWTQSLETFGVSATAAVVATTGRSPAPSARTARRLKFLTSLMASPGKNCRERISTRSA